MSGIVLGSPRFIIPPAGVINAKATVMFRPGPSWNGEFMFDWMRTGSGSDLGQTKLGGDVDYKTILGYYNNNSSGNPFVADTQDQNRDGVRDLFGKLKDEFRKFTCLNRLDAAGHTLEYLEPKLAIYKHPKETTKATAILQLQIEVTEVPKELILEFENEFFDVSLYTVPPPAAAPALLATTPDSQHAPVPETQPQPRLKQFQITKKTLTNGTFHTVDIEVECKKNFAAGIKEIKAYTVMIDPNNSSKIRKLAGTLKVLPNDVTKRKVKKIVLINVKTNFNSDRDIEEGFLVKDISEADQKVKIRKFLRQALVDPIFSTETLDLSSDGLPTTITRDNFNRTYVVGGRLKCYYMNGATVPAGWISLSDYLYAKLKALPGVGTKYDNYMRVFYMPQSGFYINANNTPGPPAAVGNLGGYTDGTEPKNIVMVAGADLTSSAHEVYHSLKLPHTWESKNHINPIYNSATNPEKNGKHSFKSKTTNNLMDYGIERDKQYFLYHWQCLVANSHASAEPINYTPAP